jgi:hypothetical protein
MELETLGWGAAKGSLALPDWTQLGATGVDRKTLRKQKPSKPSRSRVVSVQ